MKKQKSFLIAVICLFLGFITTISLAQETQGEFLTGDSGGGANLVVTSVSGPTKALLNQTKTVTYKVQNQGDIASGAYQVWLYLSKDKMIDPATDRLLKNVTSSTGLAPGQSKTKTTEVVIPNYHVNGLSGKYYFGVVVANSNMASSKQVSIVRYTRDDNETVTDHKTDLIWQQADDGEQRNWADAKKYCGDLLLGGKTDWRLPIIDELGTIIDYSLWGPAINPVFACRSDDYWSGSTGALTPGLAWGVHFNGGYSYWASKTYNGYVRCVRGGP